MDHFKIYFILGPIELLQLSVKVAHKMAESYLDSLDRLGSTAGLQSF